METQNLPAVADLANAELIAQHSDINLTVPAPSVQSDTPVVSTTIEAPIDGGSCTDINLPKPNVIPTETTDVQQPRRVPNGDKQQKRYTKEEYEQRKTFIAETIARRTARFKEAGYSDDVIVALCKYTSANRGYDEKGRHQGDFLTYLLCKLAQYCSEARNFTTNVREQLADDLNEVVSAINAGATEGEAFKIFKAQLRNRDAVSFISGRMNALVHNYGEFRYMAEGVLYLLLTFPNALNFCEHVNVPNTPAENPKVGETTDQKSDKPKFRPKQHTPAGGVKQGARPKPKGLNVGSFDALNFANGELVIDADHSIADAKKAVEDLAEAAAGGKTSEEIRGE
ncbi:MAG: hypothetical protein WCS21_10535 [Lachnospiraceae bacterium]